MTEMLIYGFVIGVVIILPILVILLAMKMYWKSEYEFLAHYKDEADKVIADLKKEVSRQKRLRCYNLKMWCSAERFTNRGRTIPEERRWWERHFYSVCRLWERLKEAV